MLIRSLTCADLDVLMGLATAAPEAPRWSRAVYESFLSASDPPKQILIAENDSSCIFGFAAAQVVAHICELQSIVVNPYARRAGIGTALFQSLVAWASGHGALRVELEVRAGNATAISFYERAGFSTDGLRRSYYREPDENAVLMSYPLPPRPAS